VRQFIFDILVKDNTRVTFLFVTLFYFYTIKGFYIRLRNLTMKKTALTLLCFSVLFVAIAQVKPAQPNVGLKWAPTGLILGSLSLQVEYNFGTKTSLTAKIGLPVSSHHSFEYNGDDADFNLKATSFLAGYRIYLGKQSLRGLYFEPFFKYVHQIGEGKTNSSLNGRPVRFGFTNDYDGVGVGAQLGAQFLIKNKFVIDLFFLGPEINAANNNFRAVEATSSLLWTEPEAEDAEREIRDFLDKFPFIRNNTKVMVDRNNRTVTADFKGALPGMRVGVSFGVAF
jgi:hypothetical protein